MSDIIEIWKSSGLPIPSRLTAIINGEIFLVISDAGGIIRMMNSNGQVFAVPQSVCLTYPNTSEWYCPRADMILCRGQSVLDLFVFDNLLPMLTR
jgi:hypothetical protein